jgi:hypothetical protein
MKEDTDKTWMEVHGGFAKDMTMRDYLAARAMQAVMGNRKEQEYWGTDYSIEEMMQFTAERAYEQADAMLKARGAK